MKLVVEKIEKLTWNLNGKRIGVLGLAFKPNTDDMRYAPSIIIIKELEKRGAAVIAYDPVSMDRARVLMPDLEYANNPYDVAKSADAVILITEWDEFTKLDMKRLYSLMRQPVFLDGRNVFDPAKMKEIGFIYSGIGR